MTSLAQKEITEPLDGVSFPSDERLDTDNDVPDLRVTAEQEVTVSGARQVIETCLHHYDFDPDSINPLAAEDAIIDTIEPPVDPVNGLNGHNGHNGHSIFRSELLASNPIHFEGRTTDDDEEDEDGIEEDGSESAILLDMSEKSRLERRDKKNRKVHGDRQRLAVLRSKKRQYERREMA